MTKGQLARNDAGAGLNARAAGDVRETYLRQIVTAAGDGAVAAMSAYHYLETL